MRPAAVALDATHFISATLNSVPGPQKPLGLHVNLPHLQSPIWLFGVVLHAFTKSVYAQVCAVADFIELGSPLGLLGSPPG
jgi:hypothetical protein